MHRALQQIADANHGIVLRHQAVQATDHTALDRAVGAGELLQLSPRTFIDAAHADDRRTLLVAALRYGGPGSALSHTTALEVWRLPGGGSQPLHLMTDDQHHLRGGRGLRVHRRADLAEDLVVRDGLRVTRLERTIVDCWPMLNRDAQRAPAILAVNRRWTTPGRLMQAVDRAPRLGGRRHFVRLIELLAAGCRSQLELWGYERVFTGGMFERLRWQEPVVLGEHTVYLDAFDPETGCDFELDGAAFHSDRADRERDLRRDAALQARGFTVVRFSHARLYREPNAVRQEALAVMSARNGGWRRPSAG